MERENSSPGKSFATVSSPQKSVAFTLAKPRAKLPVRNAVSPVYPPHETEEMSAPVRRLYKHRYDRWYMGRRPPFDPYAFTKDYPPPAGESSPGVRDLRKIHLPRMKPALASHSPDRRRKKRIGEGEVTSSPVKEVHFDPTIQTRDLEPIQEDDREDKGATRGIDAAKTHPLKTAARTITSLEDETITKALLLDETTIEGALLPDKTTPLTDREASLSSKTTPLTHRETSLRGKTTPLTHREALLSGKTTPLSIKEASLKDTTTPVTTEEALFWDQTSSLMIEDSLLLDEWTLLMTEEVLLPGEMTPVTTEKTFGVDMTIAEMIQEESVDREAAEKKSDKSKEQEDELWGLPELKPPQASEEITGCARFLINVRYAGLLLSILPLFFLVAVAADLYMESLKLFTMNLVYTMMIDDVLGSYMGCVAFGSLMATLLQNSVLSFTIVIGMVHSQLLPVQHSAVMLMGVEVGDSIHNCLVTFLLNGNEFRRAFGIVAAYDFFNLLKLLCFFPLEVATNLMFRLSEVLTYSMREEQDAKRQLTDFLPCEMIGNEELFPETFFLLTLTRTFTRYVAMVRRPIIRPDSLKSNSTVSLLSSRKGSLLSNWPYSDEFAGFLLLTTSLVFLVLSIWSFVYTMRKLICLPFALRVRCVINGYIPGRGRYATGWLTILAATGMGLAIDVAGLGFIVVIILMALGFFRLRRAFPIMLGLGMGQMVRIELMALTSRTVRDCRKSTEVVIMLLFYKVFGILLWYALPFLREAPLHAAKKVGKGVHIYNVISAIYLLGIFVLIPMLVYGVSFSGWQVELIFGLICLLLLDFVIIVNLLQAKVRNRLPWWLQSWANLGVPRWMRSFNLFESQRNKKFFSVFASGSYRLHWSSVTSIATNSLHRIRNHITGGKSQQDLPGEREDVKQ